MRRDAILNEIKKLSKINLQRGKLERREKTREKTLEFSSTTVLSTLHCLRT